MAFTGPGGGTADHYGGDAFVPSGMFDNLARIESGRRRQTTGHAFAFQPGQSCLDVGPVRPRRIGQNFKFSLHPATQPGAHLQQARYRRNRAQGNDDATFHGEISG